MILKVTYIDNTEEEYSADKVWINKRIQEKGRGRLIYHETGKADNTQKIIDLNKVNKWSIIDGLWSVSKQAYIPYPGRSCVNKY